MRAFSVSLASDTDPHIAVVGKSILFGVDLGEFSQGPARDADELMRQLKALLQDDARGDVVMSVALQAMNVLANLGYETQARETLDLIVAAFQRQRRSRAGAGNRQTAGRSPVSRLRRLS